MAKTFKDYLKEAENESGLMAYAGKKKHGAEYMKKAAKAGREGASQEELGRLKDKYSKAEKKKESMEEAIVASNYHCKDCGCQMHNCKPECQCEHDSHDETGSWWVDKNGNGVHDMDEDITTNPELDRIKELAGASIDETYDDDDDFYEAYGEMWYNEDDIMDEAEYQGRKVKLGKPMQGDVKKFKVYVKDPKTGNVKKVKFGHSGSSVKGKAMSIKKSNPARRRSFRARHNCDNPGPRTKARYWSCRKW